MILNENFIEFISLLNKNQVKYVLVGGWAVIFEGYGRTTGDIDLLIEISEENAEKVLSAISHFIKEFFNFILIRHIN
jgi:predicted nucleotidyltransferase